MRILPRLKINLLIFYTKYQSTSRAEKISSFLPPPPFYPREQAPTTPLHTTPHKPVDAHMRAQLHSPTQACAPQPDAFNLLRDENARLAAHLVSNLQPHLVSNLAADPVVPQDARERERERERESCGARSAARFEL